MTDRITDRIEIVNADCYTLLDAWPSDAALVTDPPYGIAHPCNFKTRGRGALADTHDWPDVHGDDEPFNPAPFLRFASVCLWGAINFADKLPPQSGWLVWDKRTRNDVGVNDQADGEAAWTNRVKGLRIFRHMWNGFWRDSERGEAWHPTQKPVALMGWALMKMALPAETLVIDPFAGSGSLGIACMRRGLRYLGVEIDPDHYAVMRDRLQREARQPELFQPSCDTADTGKSDCRDGSLDLPFETHERGGRDAQE